MTDRGLLLRFTLVERIFHALQALLILTLLGTGGLLFLQRLARVAWVPLEPLILVHVIAGISLAVLAVVVLLGGDTRLLDNLRIAFTWGREDLRWLVLVPLRRFDPGVELPPVGKLNPGQKLNLVAQIGLATMLFASGVVMWLVKGVLLAWYVHVIAFLIVSVLVTGHLYLALIHPATRWGLRSLLDGRVQARWAREHHPLEYPPPEEER